MSKHEALQSTFNDETEIEPADEKTADGNLELGAEGRFLVNSIEKIHPLYRRAVYLKYVEGLSPPDIGKMLGIRSNTVSVRVHRGLSELRRLTGYSAS